MVKARDFAIQKFYNDTIFKLQERERRGKIYQVFLDFFGFYPDLVDFKDRKLFAKTEISLLNDDNHYFIQGEKLIKVNFIVEESNYNDSESEWKFYEYNSYYLWKKYIPNYVINVELYVDVKTS